MVRSAGRADGPRTAPEVFAAYPRDALVPSGSPFPDPCNCGCLPLRLASSRVSSAAKSWYG
jgi:hypothetical protein